MGRSLHFKPSAAGTRTNAKRTFTKTSEAEWACATRGSRGWSRGVHTWNVRVDDVARGVSVGISRKAIDPTDADANISQRYDLYCGQGRVVDPDDNDYPCFAPVVRGSVVSIRLDLDAKTLTFGLNGVWKRKPSFAALPDGGKWYPYVALQWAGCQVTLVE